MSGTRKNFVLNFDNLANSEFKIVRREYKIRGQNRERDRENYFPQNFLVGVRGLEPPTSSSRTTRASQLRYTPKKVREF